MTEPILNNSTGFDEGKATGTFFFGLPQKRGCPIEESQQESPNFDGIADDEELTVSVSAAAAQRRQIETISKASSYWTSAGMQCHFSSGMRKKKMPMNMGGSIMRLLDKASQDGLSTELANGISLPAEPQSPSSPFGVKKFRRDAKPQAQPPNESTGATNLPGMGSSTQPKSSQMAQLHDVKIPERVPALDLEREQDPHRRKAMSDGGRVLESRGTAKLSPIVGQRNEFSFGFLKEMGLLGVRGVQDLGSSNKPRYLREQPTDKLSGIGELSTEFSSNEPVTGYLHRQNVPQSAGNPANPKVFEMPVPTHSAKALQAIHVHHRDSRPMTNTRAEDPYSVPFSKVDSYKLLPKALDLELPSQHHNPKVGITQSLPPSMAATPVSCAPSMNRVDFVKAMRNQQHSSNAPTEKFQPARPPKVAFGENFFLVGSSGHKRVFIDMKTDAPSGKGFPHSTSEKGYKYQFQVPLQLGRTDVSSNSSGTQTNHYHRLIKPNLYRSPESKPRTRTDSSQLEHSGDNSSLFLTPSAAVYRQATGLPRISPSGVAPSRSGSRRPQVPGLVGVQATMKSEQELMQINVSIRKAKPFFKEDKRSSDLSTAEEALNRSIHTKMDLLHLKYPQMDQMPTRFKYKEKAAHPDILNHPPSVGALFKHTLVAQLGSKRRPRPERDSREEQFYRDTALAGDADTQTHGQPGAGDTYKQGLGVPLTEQGNRPKFSLGRGYQAGFDK